ncbi:MAG: MMPL family transporter, partial [Gammaproteobacteria bacterium]
DYLQVARQLERLRQRFQSETVSVHIIGFAQFMGDINRGLKTVIAFFLLTLLVGGLVLVWITKKLSLATAVLSSTLVAVAWLLGLLAMVDIAMHPFGILVPFLVFAIGISHGLQMLFTWRDEFKHTSDSVQASLGSLHKLIIPGMIALLSDCIGFLTIMHIDIGVIRDTAISASIGIALLIITNILLLPILLSYCAPARTPRRELKMFVQLWPRLSQLAQRRNAMKVVGLGAVLLVAGAFKAGQLPTGDLQQGVPELRESSRYNKDARFISEHFRLNMDLLTVYAQTVADGCVDYDVMRRIDDFSWNMQKLDEVLAVSVLTKVAKTIYSGWHEGNLKWRTLPRLPAALGESISPVETSSGLLNHDCSVMPVYIYLNDHRAVTLTRVIQQARLIIDQLSNDKLRFALAGGNAGVVAATNDVVAKEQVPIIVSVYAAIIVLCVLSFRSITAALSIVIPLAVVSVLTYALMAILQIGLNVSTLPIVALSAGIGVDYAIYLYAQTQTRLQASNDFKNAYSLALQSAGKAVFFTAVILSIGVASWIFSPLKYQADMGLLLTFTFVFNMVAALLLMPSIAALMQKRSSDEVR